MTTRNITKRCSLWAAITCLLVGLTACGNSDNDADKGPTATIATAPPTTTTRTAQATNSTAHATNNPTDSARPSATTPPTIVYDDAEAAQYWEPVPAGMTPAEFQPEYLTREEVTKYVELPNPNPADWDIPTEGITADYIARVYQYLLDLHSGLIRAGVALGVDDPRVRDSVLAIDTACRAPTLLENLVSAGRISTSGPVNWSDSQNVTVVTFDQRRVTAQSYPCVFAHIRYDEVSSAGTSGQDLWIGLVRDSPPNWLNPTGWRQDTSTPGDTEDLSNFSCDAWDSEQ